ncbi:MAG: glycosyl transferase [Myxococcales bacterium]|nr:glycosyl transferase [Myxococcales bacterium]
MSVIIPTFNRREALGRALSSIQSQTVAVHETIVVDDGSNDGTAAMVAERFPKIKIIVQENQGVSAARNTGIQAATGEWIALLDSDDEWLPQKLERQIDAIEQAPQMRLCHTDEIWIRNGVRVNQMKKHEKRGGHIFEHCLPLCCMSPSSALIRCDVFDELGLFDEGLPACEDYDFWLRFCAKYPVLYVDEPLLKKYGGHEDQLSRKYWGMDRFRIRALEKALASGALSETQKDLAAGMLHTKARIYAQGARKRGRLEEATQYEQKMGEAVR